MAEYTQGPWSWDSGLNPPDGPGTYCGVSAEDGTLIADVSDCIAEGHANARLLAAAPTMLEALKAFDAAAEDAECNEGLVAGENIAEISYEIDANLFIKVLRQARAAITLAEGAQ